MHIIDDIEMSDWNLRCIILKMHKKNMNAFVCILGDRIGHGENTNKNII